MKLDMLIEIEVPKPWPQGARKAEQQKYRETVEQIVQADKSGFSTVWCVEHHFRVERSHCSAPEVLLGHVAALTENIRIGEGVALLPKPFNHPVRVAERAAALDILSNGRVEFGTGRSTRFEQDGFCVPGDEARAMWDEAIHMIPKMWTQEKFSHSGKYWEVKERSIIPQPMQDPHPPIWMAGRGVESHKIAGGYGIGMLGLTIHETIDTLANSISEYRKAIKSATPVGKFINNQSAAYTLVHVTDSRERAIESGAYAGARWFFQNLAQSSIEWESIHMPEEERLKAMPHLVRLANGDFTLEEYDNDDKIIIGTPDEVIRKMQRYQEADLDHLLCFMALGDLDQKEVLRSIELLGKEVIPALAGSRQPVPA